MSNYIQLSDQAPRRLPLDFATSVTLVAGKRGSGKTNTAKRIVEQVIRAGIPVAILDPADAWWGLRAGRDGRAEGGLPVHVFGGRHGDLPLEPSAGAMMADLVIEQRVSIVMVIRNFSGSERARFVTAFADRMVERNTEPVLVGAEEAHETMPQGKTMGQESVSLGAMLRMITLGRSSGIGVLQVTQRLARLNKTATTQSDVLFAHRTTGPQDASALEEWIKYHHAGSHRAEFMERLPQLKTGEAWLWAPDFPEDQPIGLARIAVLECETFNSHATPKVGQRLRQPKALAPVDMERLREKMAAAIERAKADDPKALRAELALARKRIAELEKAPAKVETKTKEVPALSAKDRTVIERSASMLENARDEIKVLLGDMGSEIARATGLVDSLRATLGVPRVSVGDPHFTLPTLPATPRPAYFLNEQHTTHISKSQARAERAAARVAAGPGDAEVGNGGLRRILVALAQRPHGLTNSQIGVRAQLAQSGSFRTYVSKARVNGWIAENGAVKTITDAGLAALGGYEPLPTGDSLVAYWLNELGGGAARLLTAFVEAKGATLTNEEAATAAELEFQSGSFRTYMSKLRTLQLIERDGKGHRASAELFD